jgi:hypothetical protein
MAIIVTLTSATAYSLKYRVQYDGLGGAGSGTAHLDQATLVADSASSDSPSPLGALLAATIDAGDWVALPHGAEVSLYASQERVVGASSFGARFDALIGPPAVNNLSVFCLDGVATDGLVEIRFNHSIDR